MKITYFGKDSIIFDRLALALGCPSQDAEKAERTLDMKNLVDKIFLTWNKILIRKSGSWIFYCCGLNTGCEPQVIFSCELNVVDISATDNEILGLDSVTGNIWLAQLKRVVSGEELEVVVETKQITYSLPNEGRIKQICCDLDTFYAIDGTNNIYQLKDKLIQFACLEKGTVSKFACGFQHYVILSDAGSLYSFGSGNHGELGNQEQILLRKEECPKRVDFFDDLPCTVVDVVCGGWHTLTLTSDGDVYAWGWNEFEALGIPKKQFGTVVCLPYPLDLGTAEDPIVKIYAGTRHSVVVLLSGKVYGFGWNKWKQLGDSNDTVSCHIPLQLINVPPESLSNVICTKFSTVVITKS